VRATPAFSRRASVGSTDAAVADRLAAFAAELETTVAGKNAALKAAIAQGRTASATP